MWNFIDPAFLVLLITAVTFPYLFTRVRIVRCIPKQSPCCRFGWKQNLSNFLEFQLPGLPAPHPHDWMTIYAWSGSSPAPKAGHSSSPAPKLKRSNSLSNIVWHTDWLILWRHRDVIVTSSWRHRDVIMTSSWRYQEKVVRALWGDYLIWAC